MKSLYGMGNPLMDLIMTAEADAVDVLGAVPGSMNLVDSDRQREVIASGVEREAVPGGSCANTMRGVAFLAGGEVEVVYGGAVGADDLGTRLETHLSQAGVTPRLARVDAPTGSSAIIVTPDRERTMFTHLGACRMFTAAHLDRAALERATVFHLTGYMWDTDNQRDAAVEASRIARESGALVSFDIADPFVVERYRDALIAFLPVGVDLLFGNREELERLTGVVGDPAAIAQAATALAPRVALKVGADGCWLAARGGDSPLHVAGVPVDALDTTGAGDAFAAGYLFEVMRGAADSVCGDRANRLASAIVGVRGCRYEELDRAALVSR